MKQPDRRWPRITRTLAFGALLAWGGVFVVAQRSDPAPAGTEPAVTEPTPPPVEAISLSDIASEAERVNAEIVDLKLLVSPSDAVVRARDALQDLETAITELEAEPVHTDPQSAAWSELDSVLRQWRRVAAKLKGSEKVTSERSKILEGRTTGVVHATELWTRTREDLIEQESPEAVIERIDSVLRDLAEIQHALKDRQAELFTLQDRISSDEIRVTQAMDQLTSASAEARRKIFARTAPPLWRLPADEAEEGPSLREQWEASQSRNRSDLADFRKDFRDELVLHAVLSVMLLLVLARLGRRARGWAKDEANLQTVAALLSRPFSAAYLIAATGTIVLYPDAPAPVYRIAYLTATVPLFLLVKAMVPVEWRRPLYGTVGLFALLHLGRLVPGLPLFQRLLYLVLSLVAVTGLALLHRRFRLEKRSQAGVWWRATIATCRVAALMLVFSIVANVLGVVELTLLFTGGLFNSAYMALATVVSVLILDGAVAVAMETETARKLRMVRFYPRLIRKRVSGAIHVGGALLWLWVTALLFDLSNPIVGWIAGVLNYKWTAGTLEASLGGVLAFVLTIWASVLISRFVRFVLEEDIYPRVHLARGLPGTISMLVRYSLLTIGFLIAVAAAGIPLSNFTILAGALGVGIGFGMQNMVNNFISGLILAFERPIQIGDTVEVGELLGKVKLIGIRASTVRTFEGAEVIVPNGDLISQQVTNWTLSDHRRRIRLPVGVAYGTDPQQVIDLLMQVATGHEDVLDEPEPAVLFLGFGDSSLDFEMRFWTPAYDRWWRIRSEMAVAVSAALKEAGIEIPFPQRDLHVRSVDAKAARALTGD